MLIFGGVKTPFVLSATFAGGEGIDRRFTKKFDTFGAARDALEALILANEEHLDDYSIDIRRSDLMSGDIIKFDFVPMIDLSNPERQRTRTERITKGVWSISWRKPAQTPQDLEDIALAELRARKAAELV